MDSERSSQTWLDQLGLTAGRPARAARSAEREGMRRFAAVALLVLVLLGPIMTFGGMNLSDEGTVERQIGYVVVLALAIFASLPVITRFSLIALPVPMLLALGWCWLSLSWAIDPDSSLRRLVLMTTVAWTVFILVRHSSYRSMIDVIRWCLVAAVLLSYLVVAIDPQTGIHTMTESAMPTALIGNWRGFLGHKNFAGAVCALCILLFLFDAKRFPLLLRGAIIVVAAYFLIRSQSKTSMGMLAMAITGGILFETLSRRLRAYVIPIITVLGTLIWFWTSAYLDFLKTNFFDPTAFTGRGQIWATLLRYSQDHLWFGAGFGSFWNIGPHSPVFVYGQNFVTKITVGHSGYLDLLVTVGLPGVLLAIFAAIIWPFWMLLSRTDLPAPRGALIAAMLMFCIGHNVTESGLFERDAIVSSLLFFAVAFAQFSGSRDSGGGGGRRRRSDGGGDGDDLLRTLRDRRRVTAVGLDI